jgi:inosine-uridine nucleoside N-ribohydrolase
VIKRIFSGVRRILRWLLAGVAVLLVLFAVTLALPVEEWRTGEQPSVPMPAVAPASMPEAAHRLWIDTDAACGAGAKVDPDDCLALLYLAGRKDIEIAGVSSVFGNASLETTDWTAHELARRLAQQGKAPLAVRRGAAGPMEASKGAATDAERGLTAALSAGPLTILALGPLTNLAAVLSARPDLRPNVERIVAVMGRRPGHIFHPSEGNGLGILFGHGPVFRDFNVAMDARAVAAVLAARVPLVLVPYEAARDIEIAGPDLERLADRGPAGRWVADRSWAWLAYWQDDIGRAGFYPFDLLAAVFAVEPQRFACAAVKATLGKDGSLIFPFNRSPALMVEAIGKNAPGGASPPVLYCHSSRALFAGEPVSGPAQ